MKKFRRILLLALMLAALMAIMAVGAKAYAPLDWRASSIGLDEEHIRYLKINELLEEGKIERADAVPLNVILASLEWEDGTPAPITATERVAWAPDTGYSSHRDQFSVTPADGRMIDLSNISGMALLTGSMKQLDFSGNEKFYIHIVRCEELLTSLKIEYKEDGVWKAAAGQSEDFEKDFTGYFPVLRDGGVWGIVYDKRFYPAIPGNAEVRAQLVLDERFAENAQAYMGAYATPEAAETQGRLLEGAVNGRNVSLPLEKDDNGIPNIRATIVYTRNGVRRARAIEINAVELTANIHMRIDYSPYSGGSGTWQSRGNNYELCFYTPNKDVPADAEYPLSASYSEPEDNIYRYDSSKIASVYVDGGTENIKDQLFSWDGYTANYSGDGHVFVITDIHGVTWRYTVRMEPCRDDYENYHRTDVTFFVQGFEGESDPSHEVSPLSEDSLYRSSDSSVQTFLLLSEKTVDLSRLKILFIESEGAKVYAREPGGAAVPQISGVSVVDFSKGPVQYTVVNAEGHYVKNYWVTFVQKQTEPKLFVNGPGFDAPQDAQSVEKSERREIVLADENDYHDVFIANLGASELSGLSVSLDEEAQKTLKLDDFWTVGGENNDTLTAFTETDSRKAQSMAKIRLRLKAAPENLGTSEISGLMTVTSSAGTRYVYLTGTIAPTLVTETIPNGVKYVPYSVMLQTNNHADQNQVTYTLVDGELPEGVTLDGATGELYGVPVQTGTFRFRVQASFSDAQLKSSEREYTLVIEDNTDENVAAASEDTILDYVADMAEGGYRDQVFRIDRAFNQFVKFFLDGEELVNGEDFDAVEGSTKITIRAKTFRRAGRGKHTIAAEFRDADNVMHKDAQNYNSYVTEEPADPKPTPDLKPVQPVQKPADNAAAPAGTFDDVRKSDWFYDNVMWAYEQKYMVGVSSRLFAPKQNITQAMAVTVLARLADADLKSFEKAGETAQWYATAARWADSVGLIELSEFAPAEPLPRGELAIMLVKLFDEIKVEYVKPDTDEKAVFSDAAQMTAAEEAAFQTLYYAGIFRGNGKNDMQPDASTTRAQFAALIQRVSEYIDRRSGEKA